MFKTAFQERRCLTPAINFISLSVPRLTVPEGRDGFFIMDGAFLTTDPERHRRQGEVLSEMAEAGWQTVYLTAESEAEEIIQDVTGAAVTELEQLR